MFRIMILKKKKNQKVLRNSKKERGEKKQKTSFPLFRNVKEGVEDVIDGSILVKESFQKQVPFFIFLVLLAFIYMWLNHNTNKTANEIEKNRLSIIELRHQHLLSKKELIDISLSDNMLKLIDEGDFQESKIPPYKIICK